MKTIKERAFEKYPVNEVAIPDIDEGCPSWLTEDENAIPRACYIKGATEQKIIDDAERDTAVYNLLQLKLDNEKKLWLDKVCNWLENNLGYYNRNEVHIGKSYEQCVTDDFRQAMEE